MHFVRPSGNYCKISLSKRLDMKEKTAEDSFVKVIWDPLDWSVYQLHSSLLRFRKRTCGMWYSSSDEVRLHVWYLDVYLQLSRSLSTSSSHKLRGKSKQTHKLRGKSKQNKKKTHLIQNWLGSSWFHFFISLQVFWLLISTYLGASIQES